VIADRVLGSEDKQARKRFLKHALRFTVLDRAEAERVVADLHERFVTVKTLIVDDTCVAFQPGENERGLVVFYLYGWFAGLRRPFICEPE